MAFASTLPSSMNKFAPRAVPTVFFGYPRGYKGYKLYSLDTEKFFVSRDVVFHESISPFKPFHKTKSFMIPYLIWLSPSLSLIHYLTLIKILANQHRHLLALSKIQVISTLSPCWTSGLNNLRGG